MVCPKMDMCVIVTDKRDPEKERKVKITGKTDWRISTVLEPSLGKTLSSSLSGLKTLVLSARHATNSSNI